MLAEFEAVTALETQLDALKESLMRALRDLQRASPGDMARDALYDVHSAAIRYFNHGERYAHHCIILDASKNPLWLRGVAEHCYSILGTIIIYHQTIKAECQAQKIDFRHFAPVQFSYSNMQRLVHSQLTTSHSQILIDQFTLQELPTDGFFGHVPMQIDQSMRSAIPVPKLRQIRNKIDQLFRTNDDLKAFLIDYFPALNKNLGGQSNRVAIINMLLESHEEKEIEEALHRAGSIP